MKPWRASYEPEIPRPALPWGHIVAPGHIFSITGTAIFSHRLEAGGLALKNALCWIRGGHCSSRYLHYEEALCCA
jgi:hypothetical protein